MFITRQTISVTTDASGDFTQNLAPVSGLLLKVRYVPAASDALATGADLTISTDLGEDIVSHANIGTSAFTRLYRRLIAGIDGVESTTIFDYIPVENALTLTIANGGDTLSGTFYVYIGK